MKQSPLVRRTPLKAKPRSKGNRAELEVREILRDHGYKSARRNFQSGGQGGGDLIEGIPGVHVEIKHHERTSIWDWVRQARKDARPTDIPAVIFRCNREGWQVCIPFEDFLGLCEAREL
jgi:Holliday junction resolvase